MRRAGDGVQDIPTRVFISYARADIRHLEEFCAYTADLRRSGVKFFDDRAIPPGDDFKEALLSRLDEADVVVLLLTKNYVNSSYCMDEELPRAFQNMGKKKCRILPLNVEKFYLTPESMLSGMQWTPSGEPITGRSVKARRNAWIEAAWALHQYTKTRDAAAEKTVDNNELASSRCSPSGPQDQSTIRVTPEARNGTIQALGHFRPSSTRRQSRHSWLTPGLGTAAATAIVAAVGVALAVSPWLGRHDQVGTPTDYPTYHAHSHIPPARQGHPQTPTPAIPAQMPAGSATGASTTPNPVHTTTTPRRPRRSSAETHPPSPSAPPSTHTEEAYNKNGVPTFSDYQNASGSGPGLSFRRFVQISCKIYDPGIASVNPGGYWYRIASPPWKNVYYAVANTFLNGDPTNGPYTHNYDPDVPDC